MSNSFISGQPSVQGEDGAQMNGDQQVQQDLQEYNWNLIKIDPNQPVAQPPSTRNCHSSTQFGQYLIIFGGREGDGKKRIVNDIFIFDTEKQCWHQPRVDKVKLPQPRMGHSSQVWNGSQIIIYGGWNGFQVLSDVIFIDLKKGIDKLCFNIPNIIRGESPMRQFHTSSIIDNQMFVFGGGDGKFWLNDLLILNLQGLEWSGPVTTHGIAPVGRLQHSAITFDKRIYIFGGEPDQLRQLNDIFYLDTESLTWVKPLVAGDEPSVRVSTTGCLIDSKIIYFGGYDGVHWMNDVHVFDIENNYWTKVTTSEFKPRPRCRHSANIVKGQLYIFGGNDCELSFNDIWLLSIGVQVPEPHMSKDLLKMLDTGKFADVTFIVGDTKVKAHKCILASRSDFFESMFSHNMRESVESVITVQDINLPTFKKLLEFIYSDQLVKIENADQAIDVLVAANKYGLDRLKRLCEKYLVSLIELDNVIELLYLADMHQAAELKRMCINFTINYFDIVTKREDFKKLSKTILLELLQNK